MRNYLYLFFLIAFLSCQEKDSGKEELQKKPIVSTLYKPEKDLGELFKVIQMAGIYEDSKTFVDADPKKDPKEIVKSYNELKDKDRFDLKKFVKQNFTEPIIQEGKGEIDQNEDLKTHLINHWDYLKRDPDIVRNRSTLIPLPNAYIVPGGRFREIYYWDSYFTIIGLAASGRWDLVDGMTDNFAHLIDQIGFIPNGNRTYYLSRSQPPFFSSIVALKIKGKGIESGLVYRSQLEKEYQFWMDGANELSDSNQSVQHTVRMEGGEILNRYWDKSDQPRPESFREDVLLAEKVEDKAKLYRNLRSAAESGWDFSTRWFKGDEFESIATTEIIPVDLNCLLYHLESTLADIYAFQGIDKMAEKYLKAADARKEAILKYCWNEEKQYFADYNYVNGKVSDKLTLAGSFPLYYNISDPIQALAQSKAINTKLLRPNGLLTTETTSGQQWDAPNGWAPLQWITIKGLENYKFNSLATDIKNRWMSVNHKVYENTGKMMEKYNVSDSTLVAGGGEYPTQDGFGWTNGVYLGLKLNFSEY